MLFGGDPRHWLEPMGEVGGAVGNRPIFHGARYSVCNGEIEAPAVFEGALERVIHLLGKHFLHNGIVKDHTAKIIGYRFHKLSPC